MRHFTPMQGESGQFGSRCHHKMNVLRLWNLLYNMWKMNASPKLCFFWTVCKTIVLTGTLKLKIPQNLQTWKVLTQILHLVIYPIHYTCSCRGNVIHVRTNFKPNCSKIFRCACTKTSDTYIVYILFLIQLYKYILEKYVTLDLSKPFRSKPAVFRCGVLPQLKG